jgi:tRNA G46 methylase TrmB
LNFGLHGYPTDVPYVRTFFHKLAPAWLDHVAIVSGFIPPARDTGFTFCELGCGQGVTTAILAATHPGGCFYGIDLMPSHVEHARRFAVDGAIVNVDFREPPIFPRRPAWTCPALITLWRMASIPG